MRWRERIATCAVLLAGGGAAAGDAEAQSRADGASLIPIAGMAGSLQNPCFSPDSRQIALTRWPTRYNEGAASVHVADPATGAVLARVSPEEGTAVNLPGSCWNAATNRIVFSLETDDPDWPHAAAPDGTGLQRLVALEGRVAIEPSFSPDGQRVVFEVSPFDAEGDGSIYLANVDGTGLRRLTRNADDRQPNWSPTGDRIVFQRLKGEVWDGYTVRPDGTGLRNVTKTRRWSETDIAWSPDGRRIVYSTDEYSGQIASLATVSRNGGRRARLTRSRGWYDGAPTWSPDGATIAFEARRGEPDGSAGTRLYRIAAP
jgi:TolB protein